MINNHIQLTPLAIRVRELVKKVFEACAGEDLEWDAWAKRTVEHPGQLTVGSAWMPFTTASFLRGLQVGLKAHIPIEFEVFQERRLEFAKLISKAVGRNAAAEAFGQFSAKRTKESVQALNLGEEALRNLESTDPVRPVEDRLRQAEVVMRRQIEYMRGVEGSLGEHTLQCLSTLYAEMFGKGC